MTDKKTSAYKNAMNFMFVGMKKRGIQSSCAWEWAPWWVFLEVGEGCEIVSLIIFKSMVVVG